MARIEELIRVRVQEALHSGALDEEDRRAAAQGLLPLFDDLAYRYYLREDGSVFLIDALEPEAGLQEMTAERERIAVWRAVVENAPDLVALIPAKPPRHSDCMACKGSGRAATITVAGHPSSTLCLTCLGTGWVPDEATV